MSDWQNEARILSRKLDALEKQAGRADARDTPAGAGAAVLRTKAEGEYPEDPKAFFACDLIEVGGVEEEGGAAELAAVGGVTIYAQGVGTKVPPAGTYVVAHATGGRFVFQYDGEEDE